MSRRIEARLERAAKPSQARRARRSSPASFLPSYCFLSPSSFVLSPCSLLLPATTWRRCLGAPHLVESVGVCVYCEYVELANAKWRNGGRGRKRASMRTSKGISSASSMQSSSQDENVVADKQQRGGGKLLPRGTSSRHFVRGERGVSVTRVPLIR